VLDLRSHLCLGLLDLALGFVQGAAFIELLVGAAACCDLPDHFAARMFGALFDAGVAGIGADDVLVTVQQFVDLGDIRHVGCRAYHAVYQPRLIIYADVRLHAKVILVPFLALVHFRVALAVLVLGRAGRVDQCGIDDSALAQRQAAIPQVAIDDDRVVVIVVAVGKRERSAAYKAAGKR